MNRAITVAVLGLLAIFGNALQVSALAKAPDDVALYAIDCGRLTIKDADGYADDGGLRGISRQMSDPCFLIRDRGANLLWDGGEPDALADIKGGVDIPNFHLEMPRTLKSQLAEVGLSPRDITYFAISHCHSDHIGNGYLLGHATFIVDEREHTFMFQPATVTALTAGPVANEAREALYALEHARTIQVPHGSIYDIFGDGVAVSYPAPGHTPGHRVLLLNLPKTGALILAGDIWNIAECLDRSLGQPCVDRDPNGVAPTPEVRAELLSSQQLVRKLAAEKHARIIRQHVMEDFLSVPKFPAAAH